MENIAISDQSNDRKYFTIIPNYIVNHSSAIDQALYMQMKRIAGENGLCLASEKYFKNQLNVGSKSLHNSIKYLLLHDWISQKGYKKIATAGGEQKIKVYQVNDIWKLNNDHFDKGVSKRIPLDSKGVSKRTQRGVLLSNEEEPLRRKSKIINNSGIILLNETIDEKLTRLTTRKLF